MHMHPDSHTPHTHTCAQDDWEAERTTATNGTNEADLRLLVRKPNAGCSSGAGEHLGNPEGLEDAEL